MSGAQTAHRGAQSAEGRAQRVAVLTPLPPSRTGVAHYASLVVPALSERLDVRAFASLDGYRRADFDQVIYQLGNNPHHEAMYAEAMREPGVVVLHDLVLHHLIVEVTLARGDADAYVAALEANHGAAGAAWARGRAAGLHSEMGNFLLPASVEIARRARAVIVHNEYARDRLRAFGVTTPIELVPHPYVRETRRFDRDAIRARYGLSPEHRVIGFFGFLTSAKRSAVVLEAFRAARSREPRLALLIVGEPAPDIDLEAFREEGIVTTGYVDDEQFPMFYAAADRLVNLRYPSAGETSGTLIRALDAGKPVAVSDYAQFAELPEDAVFKVPLGAGEVERLIEFFLGELVDPAAAQRRWLDSHARLDQTIDGYLRALRHDAAVVTQPRAEARSVWSGGRLGRRVSREWPPREGARRSTGTSSIPLFPELELVSAIAQREMQIEVRNIGATTIRTRTWGEPEYRLIAKLFEGERLVEDRWLALPADLPPGATAVISFPLRVQATALRLYHALQGVPMLDPEPWEVVSVR